MLIYRQHKKIGNINVDYIPTNVREIGSCPFHMIDVGKRFTSIRAQLIEFSSKSDIVYELDVI